MEKSVVVVFLGSEKDKPQAERIVSFWEKNGFGINYEVRALSAHKLAENVLSTVKGYEEKFERIVFIAVAGRSNALGPLIAGHSLFPVINCPVLSEKFNYLDFLSSLRMPSNVPCSTILEPENAALHAVKILAINNAELKKKLEEYLKKFKKGIEERDSVIKKEFERK